MVAGVETAMIRRRADRSVRPSAFLVVLALGLALLAGWASQPSGGDGVALGSDRAIHRVTHVAAPQSSVVLERTGSHGRQLLTRSPLRPVLWAVLGVLVVAATDRRAIRGRRRLLGAMVQRVPLRRRGPPAFS